MEENKDLVTSSQKHHHHHHHRHHHHHKEHKSFKDRFSFHKHRRKEYKVSTNILLVWVVLLSLAVLLLAIKLIDMQDMINRLAEYHDMSLGQTISRPNAPIHPNQIVEGVQ